MYKKKKLTLNYLYMKSIKPQLTAVLLAHTIPDRVASDDGLIVNSYKELRKYVAELSCKKIKIVSYSIGDKRKIIK